MAFDGPVDRGASNPEQLGEFNGGALTVVVKGNQVGFLARAQLGLFPLKATFALATCTGPRRRPMRPFERYERAPLRQKTPSRPPKGMSDGPFDELFAAMGCDRDRARLAFYVSTGARAAEAPDHAVFPLTGSLRAVLLPAGLSPSGQAPDHPLGLHDASTEGSVIRPFWDRFPYGAATP